MKQIAPVLLLCLLGSACAQKIVHQDPPNPKNGTFSVYFKWIKDKDKKYDMQLRLVNGTAQSVLVYADDIRCFKGKTEGMLMRSGSSVLKFHEGQGEELSLVCTFGEGPSGDYRVVVGKVFASPSLDEKMSGKVVAENVSDTLQAPAVQ